MAMEEAQAFLNLLHVSIIYNLQHVFIKTSFVISSATGDGSDDNDDCSSIVTTLFRHDRNNIG